MDWHRKVNPVNYLLGGQRGPLCVLKAKREDLERLRLKNLPPPYPLGRSLSIHVAPRL
jgi:hypothetical protein